MSSVVIVVPCYNEADRLSIDALKSAAFDPRVLRVVFVNDGSTDATRRLLEDLCEAAPDRFRLHDLPRNVGKGEAVRAGMLVALDSGANYVGYWDADLATPLTAVSDFCAVLDTRPEVEIVLGSRVRLLGRSIERRALRHYPGRVLAKAVALTLGLSIYDTQCGAKLFRASPLVRSLFREPFLTRWLFDVEVIARLVEARRGTGLPGPREIIYELPLDVWRDVPASKVRPLDFPDAFLGLARIYWRHLRRKRAKRRRLADHDR